MSAKTLSGLPSGDYYFNNAARLIPSDLSQGERYEIVSKCNIAGLLRYGADYTNVAEALKDTKANVDHFNGLSQGEQVEVMGGVRALLTTNIVTPEFKLAV